MNFVFGSFVWFGKFVCFLRVFILLGEYLVFEDGILILFLCMIWLLYLFFLMLLWKFLYLIIYLIVLYIIFFLVYFMFLCFFYFILGFMVVYLVNGFFKGIYCCCVELLCIGCKYLYLICDKFIVYIICFFYFSFFIGKFIVFFFGFLREKWVFLCLFNRYWGDIKIFFLG